MAFQRTRRLASLGRSLRSLGSPLNAYTLGVGSTSSPNDRAAQYVALDRDGSAANRVLALAVLLAGINSLAFAAERGSSKELRFQDVVPVAAATRGQIYSTALGWFSEAFKGPNATLEQNRLAGMLTGTSAERYMPPFMSSACSGWIRYRVTLLARDGRYYYAVDGFTHEGDPFCNKRSFGLLTRDWLDGSISRTVFDMTLQRPRRESAELDAWVDMKEKATAVAERVSRSLRQRLATAVGTKPAT